MYDLYMEQGYHTTLKIDPWNPNTYFLPLNFIYNAKMVQPEEGPPYKFPKYSPSPLRLASDPKVVC